MGHNRTVIDFTDPASAQLRLSHSEREDAVAALGQFATEGRLTGAEAAERADTARTAVTRGDLAPLFSDLPAPSRPESTQPESSGARQAYVPSAGASNADAHNYGPRPASGRHRTWHYAVVSVMPFASLALFFITGNIWGFSYAWLWFLLIPIAGIFTYGVGGWGDRDR